MRIITILSLSLWLLTLTGCNIEPPGDSSYYYYLNPRIAMDGSGNAVVVGVEADSVASQDELVAWHHVSGEGWSEGHVGLSEVFHPAKKNHRVAMDASGTAIAVWDQGDNLYANRYVPGSGWEGEQQIELDKPGDEDPGGGPQSPQIAMDGAGSAIVVWEQDDDIYAKRYVVGSGWEEEQLIETISGEARSTDSQPQIAMHGGGVAVVVWSQEGGVYANRYVVGSGWEEAQLIGSNSGNVTYSQPQIAMHVNGSNANAIAVWKLDDSIYANRYVVGSGWEGAQMIAPGGNDPRIAMDASGNAIVVWELDFNIYANRYVPGSGWEGEQMIGDPSILLTTAQIAMDGAGNAIALWRGSGIYANRYVPGSGWEGEQQIETDERSPKNPHLAMDGSGIAIAVWEQKNLASLGTNIKKYIFGDDAIPGGFTLTVEDTIEVGNTPTGIGVNTATNRIYVANTNSDNLSVINGLSNGIMDTIEVGDAPVAVGVNSITNLIYVANANSHNMSVIDGSNNEVITTIELGNRIIPSEVAVNPETNLIYVGNSFGTSISVIDGSSNEVVTPIEVGTSPEHVDVNPETNLVYVVSTGVTVIDGESKEIDTTIDVGLNPGGIEVNQATNRIYVTNSTEDTITVINGSTNEVITTVAVGSNPVEMGVNTEANHIYVANSVSGEVSGIDGVTNEVNSTVSMNGFPSDVGVNPDTNRIYVTNSLSTVTVIVVE